MYLVISSPQGRMGYRSLTIRGSYTRKSEAVTFAEKLAAYGVPGVARGDSILICKLEEVVTVE